MTIELRPFTEAEYHRFFRGYEADPMVEPLPYVYHEESVSRSYHYNYHVRQNYLHLGILDDEHIPLGCFQLKRIDRENGRCEFGIILQKPTLQDRGIGTLAIRQGMEIAKNRYEIKTMLGDTSSENGRMIHLFEKLGFRLTERVPGAYRLVNGQPGDRLVYKINL